MLGLVLRSAEAARLSPHATPFRSKLRVQTISSHSHLSHSPHSLDDIFIPSARKKARSVRSRRNGKKRSNSTDDTTFVSVTLNRISRILTLSTATPPRDWEADEGVSVGGVLNTLQADGSLLTREAGEVEAHATPLHLAVRYGHVACVRALLKGGADPCLRDGTGYSPYKVARKGFAVHARFVFDVWRRT